MIDTPPPKNPELEEKVLGSLLSSIEAAPVCIPKLTADSFTGGRQEIFESIRDDFDRHGEVDTDRVEHDLKSASENPEGVPGLLVRLQSEWISPDKTEEYCDILNGLAAKRRVLRGMKQEIRNIERRTPQELFTNLERLAHDNAALIQVPGLTPSQIEERDSKRERGEQIFTGDKFMDYTFFADSGSRRGQLTVPFADTGHGKTFFAVWLAARYLEQGYKGVFCVFESTDTKIKDRVKQNLQDPSNLDNLIIADVGQGMMNLDDSVSLIKYHNAVMDIDFFVADHTRIISVPGLPDWRENEKVTTVINRYMKLAQEVGAHGIPLSQVNRETLKGARGWGKDPELNNIYGSSAVEQAAEMAVSIFRPKRIEELRDYYPDGRLRAVKGPNHESDSMTYDANSVFIRQKKVREGEQYIPYVRFVHGKDGLHRATENTPF